MSEFIECDTCRAKPGTPTLCAECLRRRNAMTVEFKKVPVDWSVAERRVLRAGFHLIAGCLGEELADTGRPVQVWPISPVKIFSDAR